MQLAQLNIGKAMFDLDDPNIADFVDNLDLVNGIAEKSEGFVWRLQDESGDATSIDAYNDPRMLVNMSVWKSIEALKHFMFKSHHKDFLKRRSEWFFPMQGSSYVMWWIEDGHTPTIEEAKERLEYLNANGESARAFTMAGRFEATVYK
jgi:hypothetical protein